MLKLVCGMCFKPIEDEDVTKVRYKAGVSVCNKCYVGKSEDEIRQEFKKRVRYAIGIDNQLRH